MIARLEVGFGEHCCSGDVDGVALVGDADGCHGH